MANCGYCNKYLWLMNKPVFGFGKLLTGERLCLECFRRYGDIEGTSKTKHVTLDYVKQKLGGLDEKGLKIRAQINSVSGNKSALKAFLSDAEIKELPRILGDEEDVLAVITGFYKGGLGILVATNIRLVFVDREPTNYGHRLKVEDFGLESISSIQYVSGFASTEITIMASGNIARITGVTSGEAATFCEKVRSIIHRPKKVEVVGSSNIGTDVADQLKKFADLRDQGIITQAEFDAQKKKLLGL